MQIVPETDYQPLTSLQSGMIGHARASSGNSVYIQQFILKFTSALDLERWERAWSEVIHAQEVLRTRLAEDDRGQLLQAFPADSNVEFEISDLSGLSPAVQQARLAEFLASDLRRGFDLATDTLSRWHHFIFGDAASCLVWTSHHAILDGRSRMAILEEVGARYQRTPDSDAPPAPLRPRFSEYVAFTQSRDTAAAREFWRTALQGLESATPLDLGFPHPAALDPAEMHGRRQITLGTNLTQALKSLAASLDVTVNTLLQAAWALLLCRYTGCQDVVLGAPRACRHTGPLGGEKVIGLLMNTVPMRIHCREEMPLGAWIKEIRTHWVAMRPHEHLPLSQILEASPLAPGDALFESLVAFENASLSSRLRSLSAPFSEADAELRGASHYPLVLSGCDGDDLALELTHDRRRFDDLTAASMLKHLVHLLRQFARSPGRKVAKFTLLSPEDEAAVIALLNPPGEVLAEHRSLVQLFKEQAALHPDAIALNEGEQNLTYGELAARAQALAMRLRELDVREGDRVAISADRSLGMIIGMLAILYAGGCYVPVDVAEPRERLVGMLKDCGVKVILHGPQLAEPFAPGSAGDWSLLRYDDVSWSGAVSPWPSPHADIACILYTSGSTGRPKGVRIKHASIANLVVQTNFTSITPQDVVAQAASFCFDAATFEIWGALLNGACLTLLPRTSLLQAAALEQELLQRRITILFLTTGLCHELARQRPGMFRSLKQLVVGGEVFRPEAAERLVAAGGPARLTNGYGPTETTTFATWHDISAHHDWARPLPIGRPVSGARVYVLDQALRMLPPGIPGELYIGGAGVASGYVNDEALTAAAFVASPFSQGEALYRTGDWVRIVPCGGLDFLGRKDGQAKIRGHRVELAEVELALAQHPAVQEAVATIQPPSSGSPETVLVGHVLLHSGRDISGRELMTFLRSRLQEFLIPRQCYVWEKFSLNRNGKVDREILSRPPGPPLPLSPAAERPQKGIQEHVHRLWAELLGTADFGVHDDFFELGGNSLSAMRLFALVKQEFQLHLTPVTFFTRCTVGELASWIEETRVAAAVEPSAPRMDTVLGGCRPLSAQQRSLWESTASESSFGIWNITRRVRLRGPLSVPALKEALQAVSRRHDALRITIRVGADGEPLQQVAAACHIEVVETDVSQLATTEQRELLSRCAREEVWHPLDLAVSSIRVKLFKLGAEEHMLMVTLHHCLCDGVSLTILLEDLGRFYTAMVRGEAPQLPQPLGQSILLPDWEKRYFDSTEGRAAAKYWQEFVASVPPPVRLPVSGEKGRDADSRGRSLTTTVPSALGKKLLEQAQMLRSSPFSLFFSAFAVLVHGITSSGRFVVMTPFGRRVEPWMQNIMGMFTNALPIVFDLTGNPTFGQLVGRTRTRLQQTLQHQFHPSAWITGAAQMDQSSPQLLKSLVQLDFVEMPSMDLQHRFHELEVTLEPVEHQTIRNDLRILASLTAEPMVLRFDYPMALFEEHTIARLMEGYLGILHLVADDPEIPLTHLQCVITPSLHSQLAASADR